MTTTNINTRTPADDDIDIEALLSVLLDHKWLIGIVTGFFFASSLLFAVLATPIYQANLVVQVDKKVPDLPGLSVITQTLGASNPEAVTEIALITSRSVIGKAVNRLGLNVSVTPNRFPFVGNFMARRFQPVVPGQVAKPLFGLAQFGWGGDELKLARLDVPEAMMGQSLTLVAGANGSYVLLNEAGALLVKGQVGLLAANGGVRIQVAKLFANPGMRFDVVRERDLSVIIPLQADVQAAEKGKNSGIIGLTYEHADPAFAVELLDQVGAAYVEQNVDRNAAQVASSLRFVKEQLPIVREALEKATKALNAFQISAHSVDVSLQTKGLLEQAVAVDAGIQQLRLQLPEMERKFTSTHPAYQAIIQQINQLQKQKDAFSKQVSTLPDTQQQVLRLMRDVQVNSEVYTGLLNQSQQLEIARAGTVGNVRIVDNAATDIIHPVRPKKAAIVLGGTLAGGFLAVVFVLLRQRFSRTVVDPTDIEHLGLAVYASIPISANLAGETRGSRRGEGGGQGLLAVTSPSDLTIEALRSLRTSLHFARLEARNNVIMISGSSPNAGKTFISSNLGAVIAQAGQKVLVIDGDMRKGAQHLVFGGRADQGLSELLTHQIELKAAVRQVSGLENLHFIARGKAPPNPSEILMHPNFKALLDELMPQYDLIIIDTPPILAVTDAAVIGHFADTSLLVVRFGLNQAREVALATQRFEQNGVNIKGAVFNAVEKRTAGYYSYGFYDYKDPRS